MTGPATSWPEVSLYDICNPKQWATIPQTAFVDEGYPVYGANGKIGYYTEFNHEEPTVLITCRGATCGTINVCEPRSYVTGNSMALDNLDESRVTLRFLVYALRHHGLLKAITGTAQPQITRDSLTATSVPLPPLSTQRRIAKVLDQAEALRAKRCSAVAQLDTLIQAIFFDLFGDPATNPKRWPLSTIANVADQVTDGEHLTPKRTSEGIKLLSARNIRDGYIDFENVDHIGHEEYERIKRRCNPSSGDVLISCSGTIGRVASVETNEPFSLVRSAALVRPKRSAIAFKFLEHYLRTPVLRAHMIQRANASSQANLFQGQIRELPVLVPPLALQQEFTRRVAVVGKLKIAHRASLAEFESLFTALEHRAFRGEL